MDADLAYSFVASKAVIGAVFLSVLWFAEGAWPLFTSRFERAGHYGSNLALWVINAAVSALLVSAALLFVTEWARTAQVGLLHWVAPEPSIGRIIVAIVLIDAWQYLWHLANHKFRWLWRFHAVHHSDADLDASSGVRFHFGEVALSGFARLTLLPLLGVTIVELALYELMVLPVVLFHHSNVRIPEGFDRMLRWIIVTPRMHWVHHSDWQPETDSNYSSLFSIWDRVFRTFRLRANPSTIRLGLADFSESEWRPLSQVLLIPLRHRFESQPPDAPDQRDASAPDTGSPDSRGSASAK